MATRGFDEKFSTVDVKQVNDREWELHEPLVYHTATATLAAEPPMRTDFASVPRALVWLVPRYGRYTKAAIIHDYVWNDLVPENQMSRRDADRIFREAMTELDVAFLRRWIMWAAVRWVALTKPDGRAGWLADAWRVIGLTVLMLPIVLPPALMILAALLAFYLVEMICYLPLLATRRTRRDVLHRPAGRVNRPSLLLNIS